MSRDNFAIALTLRKTETQKTEGEISVFVSRIEAVIPEKGGSLLLMASGVTYAINETREELEKKGAAYGIIKFIGR